VLSGAKPWAKVLREARKEHDATSSLALALLLGFFCYVLVLNPLDEVQYYVLGFCNPLLYGLPLALHYALTSPYPSPPPSKQQQQQREAKEQIL